MKFFKATNIFFAILAAVILSFFIYFKLKSPHPTLLPCQQQLSNKTCEKIGQMMIVGFGGLTQDNQGKILWEDPNGTVFKEDSNIAQMIEHCHIGGVILFTRPFRNKITGKFIRDRNIQSPDQVKKLNSALQNYSKQLRQEQGYAPLPLLITVDQEGGVVDRLPFDLGFPLKTMIYQALGANEELALKNPGQKSQALMQTRHYADQMADEMKNCEFNSNLAPCVDVNINPINYVIGGRGRSFSENPEIVADQASEFIKAFNAKGIITAIKHFPGHGSSRDDSHVGLVDVTQTYQKEKELLPYRILIKEGYVDLVMTTHVINGQIDKTQCKAGSPEDSRTWCPGTMSRMTLTKLLREELGFKGVIVSDDMTMGAIANEYSLDVAFEKAINAGVDMFIISNNYEDSTEKVINTIAKLVKDDRVSEQEIDRAYNNVLALKRRLEKNN